MKRFVHNLGELKFLVAMYFMAILLLSTIGNYFAWDVKAFDIITIWEIFGMSLVFGLLHHIQTSKLAPPIRIAIHAVASYATVAVFSLICGWGFIQSVSVFWQFTITFIVVYALIFGLWTLYYKNEEAFLNRKLDEYKKNN